MSILEPRGRCTSFHNVRSVFAKSSGVCVCGDSHIVCSILLIGYRTFSIFIDVAEFTVTMFKWSASLVLLGYPNTLWVDHKGKLQVRDHYGIIRSVYLASLGSFPQAFKKFLGLILIFVVQVTAAEPTSTAANLPGRAKSLVSLSQDVLFEVVLNLTTKYIKEKI